EQVLVRLIAGLEREQRTGQPAVDGRQQQMPTGLGLEAGSVGEGALARIEALALFLPGGAADEGYRDGRSGMTARKKDGMHGRTIGCAALLARRASAVKASANGRGRQLTSH